MQSFFSHNSVGDGWLPNHATPVLFHGRMLTEKLGSQKLIKRHTANSIPRTICREKRVLCVKEYSRQDI